ncbi:hypothetical protein [Mycobacterium sp. SA01]|uniref:hypothetical protein n=1 Tax=Mycobacterium sp. SA01 TaxID=3238820 RepID=UPI00351B078C
MGGILLGPSRHHHHQCPEQAAAPAVAADLTVPLMGLFGSPAAVSQAGLLSAAGYHFDYF